MVVDDSNLSRADLKRELAKAREENQRLRQNQRSVYFRRANNGLGVNIFGIRPSGCNYILWDEIEYVKEHYDELLSLMLVKPAE